MSEGDSNPSVSLSSIFDTPRSDYTGQYNTALAPEAEAAFQNWMQQSGRSPQDLQDYDLRGYWLNSMRPTMGNAEALASGTGHLTDQFKKPNHPTFSSGSQYSSGDQPGGVWAQLPNGGPWMFMPSQTNANLYGTTNLQNYFQDREPGNLLLGVTR